MVYLDQNFWIRLSAAREARPDPGFTELLAETMERLTAFTTMRTIWRLHEDEVRESLSSFLPVHAPERPPVFGRGIRHLLPLEPFDLFSADFRTRLASEEALHGVADVLVEQPALIGRCSRGTISSSEGLSGVTTMECPHRPHYEADGGTMEGSTGV